MDLTGSILNQQCKQRVSKPGKVACLDHVHFFVFL